MTQNPFEWTETERERAQTLLEGDARNLHSGDHNDVPIEVCREWRKHIHRGGMPAGVDSRGFTRNAIRQHVTGECSHEHGVGAVAFHESGWTVSD